MTDLSIIIVSYNTAQTTKQCLETLLRVIYSEQTITVEVIVVDNASEDETISSLHKIETEYKKKNISLTAVLNSTNLGYSKANNKGAAVASGRYILFLNSDVLVEIISFKHLMTQLDQDEKIGVLTVKVVLADGTLDPASHRGFPTVWRSLSYFGGLEKLFGKVPVLNRIFGGYHLTYQNLRKIHEIDSPTGAFYLVRKDMFQKVKGFDENFFMYGEDLDLSYRIKKLGYKIIYDPSYQVTHLKYQSGLKSTDTKTKGTTKHYFYDAMRIFYDKHYAKKTWPMINKLVHWAIDNRARRV